MTGSLHTFKRLLLTFARPYAWRLAVGIVAGLLAGGSLFGILHFSSGLVKPFESTAAGTGAAPAPSAHVQAGAEPMTDAEAAEPARNGAVERWAMRLGVPVADADGRFTWQFMGLAMGAMMLFVFVKAAGTFANHYYLRWVGARVVVDLRQAMFDTLQRQSLSYYGRVDVGNLLSRCTYDTAIIEGAIAGTVADLARAPIEIVAAVAFIISAAITNQLIGVVLLLFLVFPLCILPILILGRRVKRYSRHALERISDLVSRMQENFTGIRVVKAYHMEAAESARFRDMNRRYFRAVIKALRAELFMTPFMEFAATALACGFLVVCYIQGVRLHQLLPMGAAAVLAYKPFKQLAKLNVNIQRSVAAGERLFAILDTDTSLPERADPVRVDAFRDRVAFENVGFSYTPDGPQTLADITFEMPRGSVIAFVGETGSGKTTVANLLARFYDPTAGRILLDGHDLRDIEIAALRRLVGVVTQETILFNDTVAANIAYGTPHATPAQIEDAARQANAHEFIVAETNGYNRVVGEKGFVLSGGQRQRISVARAILKNPPILILDEATSALDTATEMLVQEAINRVMAERTVFAIAHRLSTIRHAQRIFVIHQGRIVEQGTHRELHAASGRYRTLCDMQFS